MNEPIVTQKELERACRAWQARLKVQDWDILPRLVRSHEMRSPTHMGRTDFASQAKTARIKITDPRDYPPDMFTPVTPEDWETTLIHELLHVVFEPIERDVAEGENQEHERIIWPLAGLLMSQEREIRRLRDQLKMLRDVPLKEVPVIWPPVVGVASNVATP